MDDESIRTQFDDLLSALKSAGRPMNVPELSSASGMSEKDVTKWLHILEQQGRARLENRFSGVFASLPGPSSHSKPRVGKSAVEVGQSTIFSQESAFDRELRVAREREEAAKGKLSHVPPAPEAKERHKVQIEQADMQIAEAGMQLEKVEAMLAVLNAQKKLANKLREKAREMGAARGKKGEMTLISDERKVKEEAQPQEDGKYAGAEEGGSALQKPAAANLLKKGKPKPILQETAEAQPEAKPEPIVLSLVEESEKKPIQADVEFQPKETIEINLGEKDTPHTLELPDEPGLPTKIAPDREKQLREAFQHITTRQQKQKKSKIKKPEPLEITGVTTQFSERLNRQVQKIISQMHEIDKLRLEKEKLLNEHYLPMQRRLESEIETISDRVLRMEKNIIGMQERAANLPGKVSATEKLQLQSIKAHGQMRRTYDEATALLEEAGRELADEREKMEGLVEQSRHEIASHRAKTIELEKTLSNISQLEEEASNKVLDARAALAEQAERLSSAEQYSQELSQLKGEISEGVAGIKREIAAAKGVLTTIERQMEQMRQIEIYSDSIRQDYDGKMGELSDYITNGNEDFENLRESVEANFVRRYLKELRELTEGYSFELGQARKLEGSIDERISGEKVKLEELIEEGKRIAHLYELQSKEVSGSEKFEQHGEALAAMEQISQKRTQIEQMITQIVGGRHGHTPAVASTAIRTKAGPSRIRAGRASGQARKYAKPKSVQKKAKNKPAKAKKAKPKKVSAKKAKAKPTPSRKGRKAIKR